MCCSVSTDPSRCCSVEDVLCYQITDTPIDTSPKPTRQQCPTARSSRSAAWNDDGVCNSAGGGPPRQTLSPDPCTYHALLTNTVAMVTNVPPCGCMLPFMRALSCWQAHSRNPPWSLRKHWARVENNFQNLSSKQIWFLGGLQPFSRKSVLRRTTRKRILPGAWVMCLTHGLVTW